MRNLLHRKAGPGHICPTDVSTQVSSKKESFEMSCRNEWTDDTETTWGSAF